jgi:SAM-dependent methyltransferase
VAARLRGVGLGGRLLEVHVDPPLKRALVREARTLDARRRWSTTPGFERGAGHLDEESRWSLTPERLALRMGRLAKEAGYRTVVDAGCGAGGNTLGFARAGLRVVAVDQDPAKVALLRKNLAWLGVTGVETLVGRWPEVGATKADLLFLDPPWGPDWDRACTSAADFPLVGLARERRGAFGAVWAKVPPSFDPSSWPEASPEAVFGEAEGDRQRVKFVWLRA